MKRFVLFGLLLFVSMVSFSQDIIITKDAKRIECVISEVSSTEIRYKVWDNQQGPVFVLQTTEINTIIFQNGSVQVFNTQPAQTNITPDNPYNSPNPFFGGINSDLGEIQKFGNIYKANYQGKPISMDEAAYVRFIQNNSPEAWQKYYKSTQLIGAGWGLFGSGLALVTTGIPLIFLEDELGDWAWGTGVVFTILGSAATASSVPLLAFGYHTRNNNYEYYNQTVRYKSQISLNLQSSKDGIGLAIRF